MSEFLNNIIAEAKKDKKRIVFPECWDSRIIEAATEAKKLGFADPILLTNNMMTKKDEYAQILYELRKEKGMTPEEAMKLLNNPIYYGTMMVKCDDADGMVAGAATSTKDVLRPAFQIIKTAPNSKLVSSVFFMVSPFKELGDSGVFAYADCAIVVNPSAEELAYIATDTAKTYEQIVGLPARVAMISYSTKGSGEGESVEKVKEATRIAKELAPELLLDGELQVDAALVPEVGKTKAPGSTVAGSANVQIFPNLDTGNTNCKTAQRVGHCEAIGPIMQGLAKPINDLSRGATVEDILGVIAIVVIQAAQRNINKGEQKWTAEQNYAK